ncbi:TPA_asm: hypothetical protein [Girado virus 3]|nr:TPA_asm: hypothetical protein [Girado virus 3]
MHKMVTLLLLFCIIMNNSCDPVHECELYVNNVYNSIFHIGFDIQNYFNLSIEEYTTDSGIKSTDCFKRFKKQLKKCRDQIAESRLSNHLSVQLNKKTLNIKNCKFTGIYKKVDHNRYRPTSYFYITHDIKRCMCISLFPVINGLQSILKQVKFNDLPTHMVNIHNPIFFRRIPKKSIFQMRYLCDYLPSSHLCKIPISKMIQTRTIRSTNSIDLGTTFNQGKKRIKNSLKRLVANIPLTRKITAKKCNKYPEFTLQLILNIKCEIAQINQKVLILRKRISKISINIQRLSEILYLCETYTYFFGSTQTNRFIKRTTLNESSLYLPFNQYHGHLKINQLFYNTDPRFYCYYYYRSEEKKINVHHINVTQKIYLSENGQFTGLELSTQHCDYYLGKCKLSDGSIISWHVDKDLLYSRYEMFGLYNNVIKQKNVLTFPTIQSTYVIDSPLTLEEVNRYIKDELEIYKGCTFSYDIDRSIILGECNSLKNRIKRSTEHPIDYQFNLTINQVKHEIQSKLNYIQDIYYPFINLTAQSCERINDMFKQSNKIKMKYLDDFITDRTGLRDFIYEKRKGFLIIFKCKSFNELIQYDTSSMVNNNLMCNEHLPILYNNTIYYVNDDDNTIIEYSPFKKCRLINNKYYLFNNSIFIYNGINLHQTIHNNVRFQMFDLNRKPLFSRQNKWIYNEHTLNYGLIQQMQHDNKIMFDKASNSKTIDELINEKMELSKENQFSIMDDIFGFSPIRFFVPFIMHIVLFILVLKLGPIIIRFTIRSLRNIKNTTLSEINPNPRRIQYIFPKETPNIKRRTTHPTENTKSNIYDSL